MLGAAALWRYFVARRVRRDTVEDAEKARLLQELETVRKERDAGAGELKEMTARWVREVQLGVERALQPAPAPAWKVPATIPPPKFREPEPIREIRQAVEAQTLQRLRRGEPDPNSDDTIRNFSVERAAAPVTPEPKPPPYRARQVSVTEVDGRKKR